MVEIERDIYSVLEDNSVEVCAIVTSGSGSDFGFQLQAHLTIPRTYTCLYYAIDRNKCRITS